MKKILIWGLCCFGSAYADASLETYLTYLPQLKQPHGNFQEGEVAIITELDEIAKAEQA